MDYKIILGLIAVAIAFISYVPYFRDIVLGKTKPHAFTWLVWGSLTAIGFAGQIADDAGPGAWVTGFTAVIAFSIFVFALVKGKKNIVLMDWLSLAGAGVALIVWFITKEPLLSIILIVVIDALGFFPTFRKSFHKPHEETSITYTLSGLKFVIAIIALEHYSLTTYLYPASLIFTNWVFVTMIFVRKKQLRI